jgi:hypothetical protein
VPYRGGQGVSISSMRCVIRLADSYVVFLQISLHLIEVEVELLANPEVRELPLFAEIPKRIGFHEIWIIREEAVTHHVLGNQPGRGAD